jgi:hypothetical protein
VLLDAFPQNLAETNVHRESRFQEGLVPGVLLAWKEARRRIVKLQRVMRGHAVQQPTPLFTILADTATYREGKLPLKVYTLLFVYLQSTFGTGLRMESH